MLKISQINTPIQSEICGVVVNFLFNYRKIQMVIFGETGYHLLQYIEWRFPLSLLDYKLSERAFWFLSNEYKKSRV